MLPGTQRDTVGTATTGDVRDAVNAALSLLDGGERRVAEKVDGVWTVNQWLKRQCCFLSG
jgi:2,3,4,5-tetrahydropyridine-2-carboxylate N-succinyltransferase